MIHRPLATERRWTTHTSAASSRGLIVLPRPPHVVPASVVSLRCHQPQRFPYTLPAAPWTSLSPLTAYSSSIHTSHAVVSLPGGVFDSPFI